MRVAGPDIVLFALGALLFAGAATAIVTSEDGLAAITGESSPSGAFAVTFATTTIDGESADVADLGAADPVPFIVNNTRVSTVTVVVECSDNVPGPAGFQVTVAVTGPNGISAEPVRGSCGAPIEVPVEVAAVPASTTVEARTEDEAREKLAEDANATRAVGDWTVTLTGSRGPAPIGLPAANPGGTVTMRVETWAPQFSPIAK